ncbi:MAG TPA: MliC family protein [Burkholderiaceae bacterium]|nr:MliC family protein [Burkholderiaceae bacterium]
MKTLVIVLGLGLAFPAVARNSAPSRSFTTDWVCDNGRTLRFNAHPRRPEGQAQLTYIGSRVEVTATPTVAGSRYVSKDGKVVWHAKGDEGLLSFDPLLSEPLTCRLKPPSRTESKSSSKK